MTAPPFDVVQEFSRARGVDSDADWGARALVQLTFANLEGHETDRALAEVCEQVRQSGASPEEIFGDPDAWAAERLAELSEQGATFVEDGVDLNTLSIVVLGLGGVVCLMFAVMFWLGRDDGAPFGVWLAATPVLLGLAPVLLSLVWERALRRHTQLVAGAAAALTGAVLVGLTLGCFLLGQGAPRRTLAWWFAEAAALFLGAWLAGRWIPERPARMVRAHGRSAVGDAQWVELARGQLRERTDLTEAQVEEHIAQAVVHARQSGSSLADEFGNPLGYARTLPGDRLVAARRTALAKTMLLLCWLVVVFGDVSWFGSVWSTAWRLVVLGIIGWEAFGSVRAWRRVRLDAR